MSQNEQRGSYRVQTVGAATERPPAAVIMIHGRGSSPSDILSLAEVFGRNDLLYVAPEAPEGSWYPQRFTAPLASNEPGISRGLQAIDDVRRSLEGQGIDAERTVLLGFSQGACLALEYAARNARRYGGVVGLSGALIGPDGLPRNYAGSLAATPVFLGCSDVDAHIPLYRVHESAEVFERMGANVTTRIYPGMAHTVNDDEIAQVQQLLAQVAPR